MRVKVGNTVAGLEGQKLTGDWRFPALKGAAPFQGEETPLEKCGAGEPLSPRTPVRKEVPVWIARERGGQCGSGGLGLTSGKQAEGAHRAQDVGPEGARAATPWKGGADRQAEKERKEKEAARRKRCWRTGRQGARRCFRLRRTGRPSPEPSLAARRGAGAAGPGALTSRAEESAPGRLRRAGGPGPRLLPPRVTRRPSARTSLIRPDRPPAPRPSITLPARGCAGRRAEGRGRCAGAGGARGAGAAVVRERARARRRQEPPSSCARAFA
ncbi:PREDICTED: serine/arginine repetitive matrix protein 3-like [Elephantulus edwardii]|uniref:serine/arginine repetitive matrix protein 3-like n=1 Tax=Elephantulus edwardii TaxID=28737 RepID=UPI0003F0D303|nr:PREDICTED: serine/arginine repetitive matrix protein 3-like [Elephantulus edwardii]